jgi:uncharacterized protein involved in exopolysaccharide biosynthesis
VIFNVRKIAGKEDPVSVKQRNLQRLSRLRQRIQIVGDFSKSTIKITGRTFDRDMAAVLVNSYINVWVTYNLKVNRKFIGKQLAISKSQQKDYQTQLLNAENELRLFRQKFQIPPAVITITDPELQTQLDILLTKKTNAQERYERLVDVTLELERKLNAVSNNISVINPPQIPLNPSKDLRMVLILMGLAIGAAVAIIPILGWDYYRGSIRHKKDIEGTVDIPIIGTLPSIK